MMHSRRLMPMTRKIFADLKFLNQSSSLPFSVEAAIAPKFHPTFRTLENNPVCHTSDHEAKYYQIPMDIQTRLFPMYGLPRKYLEQIESFQECCIMVRQPSVELINYLEKTDFTKPAVRYMLYGDEGVGKTLALSHLVHYAFIKKWMILHIPSPTRWTVVPKETVPSQNYPERIDTPLDAAIWLQQFRSQNYHLLEEYNIRVSKRYEWSKREVTEEGEPLTTIIEHGVNRMKHASDCLAVLLKEIKLQSQVLGFKVFVAVDGVNTFFVPTKIKRPDRSLVAPEDVTIVRAVRKVLGNDWINASVVVTVGQSSSPPAKRDGFTPRYLLGKEGFELFEPFIPVLVKNYTPKEIESCLDYYIERLWIQNEEGKSDLGKEELKFLSGYNPTTLMKLCSSR